jgi:cathepsin A (carboxypeptidase C)
MRTSLLVVCFAAFFLLSFAKVQQPVFLNETYHTGFLSNHNGGELFYTLFNSRNQPDTDPLILWLTGGPGCSSELAMFTENGPFRLDNETLDLSINPYSWNNNANLLYVDQPAGTGFSIVGNYDTTEEEVARDFYHFLVEFLKKHPQFKGRSFYITGESYAGHYIPMIASYLLDQENTDINIKGAAIGNGWVDPISQYPAYSTYAFQNNIINEELHATTSEQFVQCLGELEQDNLYLSLSGCYGPYMSITGSPPAFNIYDIRLPCIGSLCYNMSYVDEYLAKPEVQEALGVVGRPWSECNQKVHSYFSLDHETSYAKYVADLLNQGIPVLVYSGEMDFACNFMGGEAWTNALEYPGHDDFIKAEYASFGEDGEYKHSHGLTFFKVLQAGHLVPMDQPETAISMLSAFINGYFDN